MNETPGSKGTCLCGSGRPFGVCCEERFRGDVTAWGAARQIEAHVMPQIAAFALHNWGPEILAAAVREFTVPSWELSAASLHGVAPVFDSWFAFTWTPDRYEDRVTVPKGWPRRPVGTLWLSDTSVARAESQFVIAAAEENVLHSPLLIESVVPGWTLTVSDMLTGRRFRIVDPDISRLALPDEMLLSGILTLDGRSFLIGTATHAVPGDWRFELRELRDCYSEDPWPSRRFWIGSQWEILNQYRKAYEHRPLARLRALGTVSDPLHLRWQVSAPFVEALERLRPLTVCFGDEEAIDEENGPDGTPRMLLGWYEPGPSGEDDDWNEIGHLYLDEGRLAADVPTPALADRLIAEVARYAGDVATLIDRRPCAPRRIHDRRSMLLPLDAEDAQRSLDTPGPSTIH